MRGAGLRAHRKMGGWISIIDHPPLSGWGRFVKALPVGMRSCMDYWKYFFCCTGIRNRQAHSIRASSRRILRSPSLLTHCNKKRQTETSMPTILCVVAEILRRLYMLIDAYTYIAPCVLGELLYTEGAEGSFVTYESRPAPREVVK